MPCWLRPWLWPMLSDYERFPDAKQPQESWVHGLSQDLETGCPKLAKVKSLGIVPVKDRRNIR